MKIAVIGAGSWGTALAQLLACNGNEVGLWARKPEVVEAVNASHANPRYLSEVELSPRIVATTSYEEALAGAQAAVIAYRTAKSPAADAEGYLDVADTSYYAQAASWAKTAGAVSGETFGPNAACTKTQLDAFVNAAA